jgi:prepilin-type N-terminal cleavage/methylation domain-containing protein
MSKRPAFTLMEVLISIALMGIILPALYQSVDLLRDNNTHLFEYLEKAKKVTAATDVLYLDIASSDGNLSIQKDDFTRLCIEQTYNSLYALPSAKVCWVVSKRDKRLLRLEGNDYRLPLRFDDRVEVNTVMKNLELFDVYYQKEKVLVLIQQKGKESISFMVQGISKPKPPKKKLKVPNNKRTAPPGQETNTTSPKPPALT